MLMRYDVVADTPYDADDIIRVADTIMLMSVI
jgi:hypothetical protein